MILPMNTKKRRSNPRFAPKDNPLFFFLKPNLCQLCSFFFQLNFPPTPFSSFSWVYIEEKVECWLTWSVAASSERAWATWWLAAGDGMNRQLVCNWLACTGNKERKMEDGRACKWGRDMGMQLGNARHTSGGRDMGVQLVLGEWTAVSGLETRKEKREKE